MNKLVFIGLLITSAQSLFGQIDRLGSWMVNLDFGLEAHDKRLFDFVEKESATGIPHRSPRRSLSHWLPFVNFVKSAA